MGLGVERTEKKIIKYEDDNKESKVCVTLPHISKYQTTSSIIDIEAGR